MKLVLEIPSELEAELSAKAEQEGTGLNKYILGLLKGTYQQSRTLTSAELVAYWSEVGVIGMRQDIEDSQVHARTLRENAQQRGLV